MENYGQNQSEFNSSIALLQEIYKWRQVIGVLKSEKRFQEWLEYISYYQDTLRAVMTYKQVDEFKERYLLLHQKMQAADKQNNRFRRGTKSNQIPFELVWDIKELEGWLTDIAQEKGVLLKFRSDAENALK